MFLTPTTCQKIQKLDVCWNTLTNFERISKLIWDREFDIDECMVEHFGRYRNF